MEVPERHGSVPGVGGGQRRTGPDPEARRNRRSHSEARHRWDDWYARRDHSMDPDLALPEFLAGGEVEIVEILTAKADVGRPHARLGFADDAVHAPGLIAELNPEVSRHVQPAFLVDAQSVATGTVGLSGRCR